VITRRTKLFAFLVPCALCAAGARPQAKENAKAVELTQVDLFSLPDWQNRPVSVDEFIVGMTREQALAMAKAKDLRVASNAAPRTVGELNGPCQQGSCSVYKTRGNYIGIDLFLERDRVTKVTVAISRDMDPEVREVNVTREFKGLTYRFFNRYSDSLRDRILGAAEGKETPERPGAAITHVEYAYPRQGLIVHTTIDKRDHPPKAFDLEVDFLSHE
jgi:hypothetical protein